MLRSGFRAEGARMPCARGIGLAHGPGKGLRWRRRCVGLAVGAPVARELLPGGVHKAAVRWTAEVDDVEWRNGVARYDGAVKRIGDGEREDGAKQGVDFLKHRDGVGREVEQAIGGRA